MSKCTEKPHLCAKWHPRIEKMMRQLVAEARRNGRDCVIDMSKLARAVGVSRPTLYKHEAFILKIQKVLEVERRRADGHAAMTFLEERVEKSIKERDEARADAAAMRAALAQIHQSLALNAAPVLALVEAELRRHGIEADRCPLCGTVGADLAPPETNVVSLSPRSAP